MKGMCWVAAATLPVWVLVAGCRRSSDRPGVQASALRVTTEDRAVDAESAASPGATPPTRTTPRQQAGTAVQRLRMALKHALEQALPAGLPQAIAVCQLKAPEVAQAIASASGVELGRTSSRLRNPRNAPSAWAKPLLAAFEADPRGAWPAQRSVELPGGRRGYAEPIIVQGPCLMCHGESLDATVAATLAQRYPRDQARGYRLGDLRGIFWATVSPVPDRTKSAPRPAPSPAPSP